MLKLFVSPDGVKVMNTTEIFDHHYSVTVKTAIFFPMYFLVKCDCDISKLSLYFGFRDF